MCFDLFSKISKNEKSRTLLKEDKQVKIRTATVSLKKSFGETQKHQTNTHNLLLLGGAPGSVLAVLFSLVAVRLCFSRPF